MTLSTPDKNVEQIRQYSRQLVRELDVVKGSYLGTGCTFVQCHALFELAANDSLHLMELAEILLVDKSNASRTVKRLKELGLVVSETGKLDKRQKSFRLTAAGKRVLQKTVTVAHRQVELALENLDPGQQQTVVEGLRLYSSALRKSRMQGTAKIRLIRKKDNPSVASLIQEVMTEFEAIGEGYSSVDPEVSDMYGNYQADGYCYYVIENDKGVVGAGGIAPLRGGAKTTCELRKMFFRPEIRGLGLGRRLLLLLLEQARQMNYKTCYLETLDRMPRAINLYIKNGFQKLDKPMGKTGHCSCDHWYALKL